MTVVANTFSAWIHWQDRNSLPNLCSPGVYAIAYSSNDLNEAKFTVSQEVVYFGVAGDLRKRLKQFDNTISRKNTNHGGALRMLNKYRIYDELVPKLYVAIRAIERGPLGGISDTLRRKGDAQQLECHCIAAYLDAYSMLPQFNDKNSAKFTNK